MEERAPLRNLTIRDPSEGKQSVTDKKQTMLWFAAGLLIGIVLFFALYFGIPRPCRDSQVNQKDENQYQKGYRSFTSAAVASDAGPCSEIGAKKLREGGSVVDAAIATMVCGGLYNPQSAGIGGGSFMAIYNAEKMETIFINSRETAPLKSNADMYGGNGFLSQIGSLAIAVPGEVAGYWQAHKRYGKLEWSKLFEDSIRLAEEGVKVSAALERDIKKEEHYIRNSTLNLKPIFTNADGTLKKEGDVVVRTALGKTLRAIADEGMNGFYNGSLARRIIADIEDAVEDSIITLEDLKQYQSEVKPLLNVSFGDLTVFTPSTPSSGPVLALILNILKGYNFTSQDIEEDEVLTNHRIIEAFKYAYAHRSQLGDEDFSENVTKVVQKMISPEYGEQLRSQITDDKTFTSTHYGGDFEKDFGTSHISIVDSDGNAIAATSTINTRFGSKVRGVRTGIIFNNEMDDFSSPNVVNYFGLPPSQRNFIVPKKRPMSSMTPTIVLRKGSKRPRLVTGASGGTKITTATALIIIRTGWFGYSVNDATSDARIHHQLYPTYMEYEEGMNVSIIRELKRKGHEVKSFTLGSVAQSVESLDDDNDMTAVCDWRKGGYPDGY